MQKIHKTTAGIKKNMLKEISESKLIDTKVGVTSDEGETISEVPGLGKVYWCYRGTPDSLGNACAVSNRDDADHIEACVVLNGQDHSVKIKLTN